MKESATETIFFPVEPGSRFYQAYTELASRYQAHYGVCSHVPSSIGSFMELDALNLPKQIIEVKKPAILQGDQAFAREVLWHAAQHFAPILKDGSAGRGVLEGDLVQRIIFDNVCYQTGVEIYGEGFLFGFKPGQLLTAVVKSKYDLREMNGRKIWPLRREAGQNDYSIHNCIAEAVLSGQPISEILNRALLTQISCGNLDLAAIPGAQALSEYHQFVHTFIEAFDPQNVHLDGMNHTVHLLQMLKNPLTTELNLESPKSLERELNLRLEGIASCLRTEATIRLGRTLYGGEDLRLR